MPTPWTLTVTNRNTVAPATLENYPVVLDPPPPRRERDPAGDIPYKGKHAVATDGPAEVWTSGPFTTTDAEPNGMYLSWDLTSQDSAIVQIRVYHYQIAPGQAPTDPTQAPILLSQQDFSEDASNGPNLLVTVGDDWAMSVTQAEVGLPT